MGDTSSGKSSLLSALSGILLPANDQITTRCPTRLRMENAEQRRASISVRWQFTSGYKSEAAYKLTHLSEEKDGASFYSNITSEIEKAQKAIIDTSKLEVTRDIIEVEYCGPDCYNLTLTDLPGIVRVAGKGESASIIVDIQLLIKEYLENERCVVLAVVPANVDFHNSGIMADAEKYDPTTRRTIPVITKPDLIDKGAEGGVLKLLLGEMTCTFQMGFHMVKCRGQAQLNEGVTLEQGVEKEAQFFKNEDPWRKESEKRADLFGVPALRRKLEALQMRMIQESIPSILRDIESEREGARGEVKRLGGVLATPSERRAHFSSATRRAMDSLKAQQAGQGSGVEKTSAAVQQEAYDEFGRQILSKRLANVSLVEMGMRVVVSKADGEEGGRVVALSADGSKVHVLPDNLDTTGLLGKNIHQDIRVDALGLLCVCTIATCPMCRNGGRGSACIVTTELPSTLCPFGYMKPFLQFDACDVSCEAQWLETLIRNHRNNDLPCFLSAALFKSIVAGMVKTDWAPLCQALVTDTRNTLQLYISQAFTIALPERFPATAEYVSECVAEVCAQCLLPVYNPSLYYNVYNPSLYTIMFI
ncbi:P-loop containing nucleoside triphosphate hydrolase protein [Ochromonadaceae sp. CCMP2298]|nr:P-loop containing nucleoside triphosphate hydrolase protein [Ochromonadaceae sp. CCMP2298]